jgi:hypothetical protein
MVEYLPCVAAFIAAPGPGGLNWRTASRRSISNVNPSLNLTENALASGTPAAAIG